MIGLYEDVEDERERLVRTVPCPVCGAKRRSRCLYPHPLRRSGLSPQVMSHTGRYDVACVAGLVPWMVGR